MRKVIRKSSADSLKVKELKSISHYLSTGCTILDLSISDCLPGGFGAGRISHIFGPESSTKSILVAEPLGSATRQGGDAHLIDVEGTFDFGRAALFGIDAKKLNYISPYDEDAPEEMTVEYLFDECLTKIEKSVGGLKKPSAVGIDSLSAITSERELDDADPYGANKAKMLSAKFRQHIWKINKLNLALIFVDQTRQNVGGFGKKLTFGGGDALKFYASTRLYVEKKGNIVNKFKRKIGIEVYFKVEKNKIASPFREGTFLLLFDYGIDNTGTSLTFLFEHDSDATKGWYKFKEKKLRFKDMVHYIEENDLEKELESEVYKKWREIYAAPERKERIR